MSARTAVHPVGDLEIAAALSRSETTICSTPIATGSAQKHTLRRPARVQTSPPPLIDGTQEAAKAEE
jgi:hypothetical protein